jgi:heterodisulfide reductase subunit A
VYSTCEAYPCSKDGLDRINAAIHEFGLERVLIAGCSPRLVKKLFQESVKEAGLRPDYVEVVDIREGCAYVHPTEIEAAFQKSIDLVKMGAARLSKITKGQEKTAKPLHSAMVIGSGLSGLTSTLMLANSGIPVFLIERSEQLGGKLFPIQDNASELIKEKIEAINEHPNIQIIPKAEVLQVQGPPGNYQIIVSQNGKMIEVSTGTVLIAGGAFQKEVNDSHHNNRRCVRTPFEFEEEIRSSKNGGFEISDVVILLPGGKDEDFDCTPLHCDTAIRQALGVKQLKPETNVTILFQDLILGTAGGKSEQDFLWAKEEGVKFVRYLPEYPPIIDNGSVELYDPTSNAMLEITCDRIVISPPIMPREDVNTLAKLFHIPQDKFGFLIEQRIPLRPGFYVEDGIYVLGSAHKPVDSGVSLFQAYLTVTRVLDFLFQETLSTKAPVADIDSALCTGCGACAQVCMMDAIHIEPKDGILSLAEVYSLRCTGCGNCAVVCPVKAITIPGWNDLAILAQIDAAFDSVSYPIETGEKNTSPTHILAFSCEWSALLDAEIAGARHFTYPADVRILPVNCAARIDPDHILWAFLNDIDGVFLGVCHPCECHYGSGSLFLEERVEELKKQLDYFGIDTNRLCLEFMTGDDGENFARSINDFAKRLDKFTALKKPNDNPTGGLDVEKIRS